MTLTREKLHTRHIQADGFKRSDGLYEIEAFITDNKHYSFHNDFRGQLKPGDYLHDMRIYLLLDNELTVLDISAETKASPFAICPKITSNYKKLIGLKITHGWSRSVRKIVGKQQGCTHITELLLYLGTVAIQTIFGDASRQKNTVADQDNAFSQSLINSCHAWAEDSPVTKKYLPAFYNKD